MTTTEHKPVTLDFHSLGVYNWSMRSTKVEFHTSKGHTISTGLIEAELDIIKDIIDAARQRALKEVPEVIAEVIAEERVQQILAKREADAALLAAPEAPADNFEPGVF